MGFNTVLCNQDKRIPEADYSMTQSETQLAQCIEFFALKHANKLTFIQAPRCVNTVRS